MKQTLYDWFSGSSWLKAAEWGKSFEVSFDFGQSS